MASTSTAYATARSAHLAAGINYSSDTIKLLLVTSAYTPDYDNHQYRSSVTNEVASANGYTTGGITLSNKTVTKVGTGGSARYAAKSDPTVWTASGGSITARGAILYKDTGNSATSQLLAYILLDNTPADVTATSAGTLTVTPDATNGWYYI